MAKETKRVLMTGAAGQIGSELAEALRKKHGRDNVLVTDVVRPPAVLAEAGPFELLDVTDRAAIDALVRTFNADTVYHLAALLSATGEKNPQKAWDVNMGGLRNVLEVGRARGLVRIFSPSSIAVFGPTTIYGVTKVAGELLADYYVAKYGLDVRGCRYPGIISHLTPPGGGTTDYAVAIFYDAVKNGRYTCFLREDTRLPMMYMPDCLKCTLDLMDADFARLKHHAGFNVTAMSFSAGELAAEIRKHVPAFEVRYEPDFRQAIADSWPASIDDSAARAEWGWKPDYGLAAMTADMMAALRDREAEGTLGG